MKKGLRRPAERQPFSVRRLNDWPDEEGIKTSGNSSLSTSRDWTIDLMKKGLRPPKRAIVALFDDWTIDLMKKGLRPDSPVAFKKACDWTIDLMKKGLRLITFCISKRAWDWTIDLMKKGLRQSAVSMFTVLLWLNDWPDEEGIKTTPYREHCNFQRIERLTWWRRD